MNPHAAAAPTMLADRPVGPGHPVLIVCEAGVTNYGDVGLATRQIDAAAAAGADVVKFQVWRTERLVSRRVAERLARDLGQDWFARLKSKELGRRDLVELHRHAAGRGMIFSATAHDEVSLEFIDRELDVPFFKIGSGEAHNTPFLESVARRRKPVVISFGFQSDGEVSAALATLRTAGTRAVVPLHCVTEYPTPADLADLGRIERLRRLLGTPIGYSDHTVGWHIPLAAVALGACLIEKHLTFDKADPRSLDNPGALLPDEFRRFVQEVRDVERSLQEPPVEMGVRSAVRARAWAGPSVVAARPIAARTVIDASMLALKRPAQGGLGPNALAALIGRTARRDIPEDEQVTDEDLE